MKKLIMSFIALILVSMAIVSCSDLTNLGPFVKVSVTGKYTNEVDGNLSDDEETLTALVSVTELAKSRGGGAKAHINGFIMKGPFDGTVDVKLEILDRDMGKMAETEVSQTLDNGTTFEFDENAINKLASAIKIPAGSKVNVNPLTFFQAERVEKLMKDGEKYTTASKQAKNEIFKALQIDKFKDGAGIKGKFHTLRVDEDGDDNGILLIMSAAFAGNGGSDSDINKFANDIKEDGTVEDALKNTIATKRTQMGTDGRLTGIKNNIEDALTGVTIPDPSDEVKTWATTNHGD